MPDEEICEFLRGQKDINIRVYVDVDKFGAWLKVNNESFEISFDPSVQ